MKKISKITIVLALAAAIIMSLSACSSGSGNKADTGAANAEALQSILEAFKADEQYAGYKAMYPNTTFEEKIEGNSIVLNISGDEGAQGNYEYKLDGDYLTYTQETNSDDYIGISFFMYLKSAADKYLGMDSNLTTGYIAGCEYFGIENKYYITETDDEAGTTTNKLYIANKWDMPELDKMYINDKALEYNSALTDDEISGVVNSGKIRAYYYGNKNSVDIVFSEYGKRDDLTYQSMMNVVSKLLPEESDVFAKYYTELKESEGDGFKITFGLDDSLKAEHEIEELEGYEYTIIHFGA